MNFFALLSLLGFIMLLSIGVFVFSKSPTLPLNRLFFCYCLAAAAGSFGEYSFLLADTAHNATLWATGTSLWAIILVFQIHFVLVFTEKFDFLKRKLAYLPLYAPALIFWYLTVSTNQFNRTPVQESWGWTFLAPERTPLVLLANVWISLMALLALILTLHFAFNASTSRKRRQAILVFVGLFMNTVWNIVTQGILPEQGVKFPHLVSFGALLSSLFFAYAILKHGLFILTPKSAAENIIATMSDCLFLASPENNILGD